MTPVIGKEAMRKKKVRGGQDAAVEATLGQARPTAPTGRALPADTTVSGTLRFYCENSSHQPDCAAAREPAGTGPGLGRLLRYRHSTFGARFGAPSRGTPSILCPSRTRLRHRDTSTRSSRKRLFFYQNAKYRDNSASHPYSLCVSHCLVSSYYSSFNFYFPRHFFPSPPVPSAPSPKNDNEGDANSFGIWPQRFINRGSSTRAAAP